MSDMWKSNNIDYFHSEFDDHKPETDLIDSSSHYIYYRDIYIFINYLCILILIKELKVLQVTISVCLYETVLLWHIIELTNIKQDLLENADLNQWYIILVKWFKKRTLAALQNIQNNKYIMINTYKDKFSYIFTQKLFHHIKAAEIMSVYNQLIIVWNNLDFKFKMHVLKPQFNIIMTQFLKLLDLKMSIWGEMTWKHHHLTLITLNQTNWFNQNRLQYSEYQSYNQFQFHEWGFNLNY